MLKEPLAQNYEYSQQPKTYPHPRIPAARLFSVSLCLPMFSSTWGNPEVGGGDNCWGSYIAAH